MRKWRQSTKKEKEGKRIWEVFFLAILSHLPAGTTREGLVLTECLALSILLASLFLSH
jgi:hypothetical protein